MENSKQYKLYKDGKHLVIGAVAVVGVAMSAGVSSVSADTITDSSSNAQIIKTADTTKPDPQATTDTPKVEDTQATSDTSKLDEVKSNINTSTAQNATQDEAKKNVEEAQDTLKNDADNAENAGVNVTTGDTQEVTIDKDNATDKTNEILSDLNKQDEAVNQATETQKQNEEAYNTAKEDHDDTVKQGQEDLGNATTDLNHQVDETKNAGIDVNVEVAQSSPEYKDLAGLTGQELLDAMAHNIEKYKQAIANAVDSENADTKKLQVMVAEYKQKQADFEKANNDRDEAVKQGQEDLGNATSDLDKQVEDSKNAGLDVSVAVSKISPEYKDLTGLAGQDLLDAMNYNIDLYKKAVASGVASEKQDKETLAKLTAEYQKQVAEYEAQKAAVDKANAEKQAAYEKALEDYMNGTNHETSMTAQTQTDAGEGQYQTFMNATVDQKTGEFTLEHDMNDGVHIIGHGVLKGKINWQIVSNGDGTETVTISTIELYSYTYTNAYQNQAVNQNINFHVYDNDGNELFSVYHDGNSTFSKDINKTAHINKTFKISPNETTPLTQVLVVDDNWIWNTHGQVSTQIKNTNVAPKAPEYEKDPVAPTAPSATVHHVEVVAPEQGQAPVAPSATVTTYNVDDLPAPEAPKPQEVSVHYYNVTTTPEVVETPTVEPVTPAQPEEKAPVQAGIFNLPHTNAEKNNGTGLAGVLAGLASVGLLFGISKKGKKQN